MGVIWVLVKLQFGFQFGYCNLGVKFRFQFGYCNLGLGFSLSQFQVLMWV